MRMFETTKMGPKKKPIRESVDPETEKQFREERIARELFQVEVKTQLPKPTRKIVDIDDKNATLASMLTIKLWCHQKTREIQDHNCTAAFCTFLE